MLEALSDLWVPKKKKVPRLGPPTNLRPGGPHKGIKDTPRPEREREALKEEITDVQYPSEE